MRTIIGIAGVKTSGKTTVTEMIKKMTEGTTESALADKLKNVCSNIFKLERKYFDAQELKEVPFEKPFILSSAMISQVLTDFNISMGLDEYKTKYIPIVGTELETPRRIAQVVGTEILRATGDEDVHCRNIVLNSEENKPTVISDLRFPNEFTYFNENPEFNFIPLYINRKEAEDKVTPESHASETSVFLFNEKCIKIDNNGSLESTQKQVKDILVSRNLLNG